MAVWHIWLSQCHSRTVYQWTRGHERFSVLREGFIFLAYMDSAIPISAQPQHKTGDFNADFYQFHDFDVDFHVWCVCVTVVNVISEGCVWLAKTGVTEVLAKFIAQGASALSYTKSSQRLICAYYKLSYIPTFFFVHLPRTQFSQVWRCDEAAGRRGYVGRSAFPRTPDPF